MIWLQQIWQLQVAVAVAEAAAGTPATLRPSLSADFTQFSIFNFSCCNLCIQVAAKGSNVDDDEANCFCRCCILHLVSGSLHLVSAGCILQFAECQVRALCNSVLLLSKAGIIMSHKLREHNVKFSMLMPGFKSQTRKRNYQFQIEKITSGSILFILILHFYFIWFLIKPP